MGFLNTFFAKPANATGTPLSVHMFMPRAVKRHTRTLLKDPRYFVDRLATMAYQALHPNDPWLTAASIALIRNYVTPNMRGFEWGSGRSTLFFARQMERLVSVEHDAQWFQRVRSQLREQQLTNVDYHFVDIRENRASYHQVIERYPDRHFDLILVDGESRVNCLKAAVPKLASGGCIVLDNSEEVGTPVSSHRFRQVDTTNGVWHTTLFFCTEPTRNRQSENARQTALKTPQ